VSQVKQILDEYRLEGVVKTSVCTTVFQAIDPRTDGRVVIKLINPAGPVAEEANRSRFVQALQVAQSGDIRALPRTMDFGFTPEENAFLVTELIEPAVRLGSIAGEPPSRMVSVLVGVLDAVDELAMAGSAHLNLSPDNVLVTDDTVRIVGLGTGAYLVGAPSGVWPAEGNRYAAPELFGRGVARRDDLWLADLYSMSLMACDLLGVDVEGHGTADPKVEVRDAGAEGAQQFESVAAVALRGDTSARTVAVSELRRALVKCAFPTVEGAGAAIPAEPVVIPDKTLRIPLPTALTDADAAMVGSDETPVPTSGGAVSETVVVPLPPTPVETPVEIAKPPEPTAEPKQIPAAEPVKEAEPDPSAQTHPSAGPGAGAQVPWRLVGAAVAAVVVLAVVMTLMPTGGPEPAPEPVVEPVAQLPTPTAVPAPEPVQEILPSIHPLLEQAELQLAEGDLEGARAAYEALTDEEIDQFSGVEQDIYFAVLDAVEGTDQGTALKDLRGGLKAGSIRMLRRGVAGLADLDQSEIQAEPGLREDLDHARNSLRTHERLWTANKNGNHVAVLEQSRRMISLLPDYSGSYKLRDESATAIEEQAETAIAARDFDSAVQHLESIHRFWPGRDGLVERMEWCRLEKASDVRLQDVLDRALAAGAQGDPEQGLRVLAGASASGALAGSVAEARDLLEQQLAGLDARPPEIRLPPDFTLAYKKNETVVVPITVTDDYRVERVAVHVRGPDDPAYREIELQRAADGGYPFQVTPALHGNAKLFFYVVATDRSGHAANLAGETQPLVLERKRWYRR
jgi:hypothetical protein